MAWVSPIALAAHAYPPGLRRDLEKTLRRFSCVTVHAQTAQVDRKEQFADPQVRDDLLQDHVKMMAFARDVGGRVVTYHPFMPHKYDIMLVPRFEDTETIAVHVKAGRHLLPHARQMDVVIGFEAFDTRIVDGIDDPRWGSLFDIGHASQNGARPPYREVTEQAVDMIRSRLNRILQFHVHGVRRKGDGYVAHQPIDDKNLIDYGEIMRLLTNGGFRGPLIFEILRIDDQPMSFDETIAACVAAKSQLLEGGGANEK